MNKLQKSSENERMHGHAYSTYTNIIYKSIFGKDAKHLRGEYGITDKEELRNCFNLAELKKIQNAEMLVSSLVEYGWEYDEIKEFLLNKVTAMTASKPKHKSNPTIIFVQKGNQIQ